MEIDRPLSPRQIKDLEKEQEEILRFERKKQKKGEELPQAKAERLREISGLLAQHRETTRQGAIEAMQGNLEIEQTETFAETQSIDHQLLPPSMRGVEIKEDITSLIAEFKSICEDVGGNRRWPPNELQHFLERCRALNPAFQPFLEGSTTRMGKLDAFKNEFFERICMPQNIFLDIETLGTENVVIHRGTLLGNWREHSSPIGSPVWSGEVEWEHGDGSCGLAVGRIGLIAPSRIHAAVQRRQLEFERLSDPFRVALKKTLQGENSLFQLEYDRCLLEEIEHCRDNEYCKQYGILHPDMRINNINVESILADHEVVLRSLWRRNSGDAVWEAGISNTVVELSAKLRGLIEYMKEKCIEGKDDQAWVMFLRMATELHYQRGQLPPGEDATHLFSYVAHSDLTRVAYSLAALQILKNMHPSDDSPVAILNTCTTGTRSPAHIALNLLEKSAAQSLRSLDDRKAQLSASQQRSQPDIFGFQFTV
ncbi:MAG: hypothetical protein AAB853_01755 [Patescibacteria group bacterium]